jgi:AcrR family transcriptional regulator
MNESWHEKVKNKNRDEIIAAGKELFLKHNFLNVNIKEVCELAGTSRVTFYKYFSTIDELIFEVQIDILNSMTQFIKAADKAEVSGLERLRLMLQAWVDFAKQHKDYMKFIILFDLYYEAYKTNEELKQRYKNFISNENKDNFLDSAINKGIEDKSLRGDLDTIKSGYYIFSTMMGVLQRMSYTTLANKNHDIVFEEISESVVQSILNHIKNSDYTNL